MPNEMFHMSIWETAQQKQKTLIGYILCLSQVRRANRISLLPDKTSW